MAIALLPLREGERLGSNFARYANLMGFSRTAKLRKMLFGYFCFPNTRLPSAIDYLADQTRDYWNLTGEEIVRNFTEFQYVTMMCSRSTRERLMRRMLDCPSRGGPPLRLTKSDSERTKKLRYCPECMQEWRSNGELLYWKIDHQLAGVYFCTKHSCVLKVVGKHYSEYNNDFTVEQLIGSGDEEVVGGEAPSERSAIESVARLSVNQRVSGSAFGSIESYRDLFRDAGFTRGDSTLKKDNVVRAWLDFFGARYCHMTGISASRIHGWISSVTDRAVQREFPHPFMYIAAECTLNYHASLPGSFFPGGRENSPRCAGNMDVATIISKADICKGLLHRSSDFVKVTGSLRRSGGIKLVCTCGVSYRMLITEKGEVGKLTPFSYGCRYRACFKALISKGEKLSRVAKRLHIANSTALKWVSVSRGNANRGRSRREIINLRKEWRLLVEGSSSDRRITTAAEAKPLLYKTLRENDRGWFIEFNRAHRSWRPQSSYKANEPTTDEIREAHTALQLVEPPIRCSKAAILERAGFCGRVAPDRPLAAFLANLTESPCAYRERVIAWLETRASGRQLGTCDQALRHAGVRARSFTREQRRQIREIGVAP
ncbi:TnsD family Tn7-like transposition protein [Paraburkholderia sp. SIMBA_055]